MELFNFLSKNAFFGAFVAGVAVIVIVTISAWLYRKFVMAPKVYEALNAGLTKHDCTFLPSSFLASETSYTIVEIEKLCTMHPNITRNKKQLESWCIK
jgi:hypothetical protein